MSEKRFLTKRRSEASARARQGARAGQARADTKTERAPRSLSMLVSSLALIAGKVATMGLGFLFWILAAQLFVPAEVGLAAGAVSAVMLCTQLALLGVGSSVIVHFPRHGARPAALLDTAFTVVIASAFLAAVMFLLLALGAFDQLRVVASDPAFAVSFVGMSILGTAGILFDQISTALRRGDQALARALLFGIVTISLLAGIAAATKTTTSFGIFVTWVGGALGACLLGALQLRRSPSRYRFRPRLEPSLTRSLLGVGLPNHALTLTERAPGLILPIVVTELVSAEANAAWYTAWMMAWVLYIVPIQVGMTLFAEAAHRPAELGKLVRDGIRISLAIALPACAALAVLAHFALSILGPTYAEAGTTPLRILVIAVVPLTMIQAYFVVCRSTRRLREATLTGAVNGLASVGGAAAAGIAFGLTGMAVAWLTAQLLTSAWAVVRLWRLASTSENAARAVTGAAPAPAIPETASSVVHSWPQGT
jgi:O-antigen/teichoic acid export membrane protein